MSDYTSFVEHAQKVFDQGAEGSPLPLATGDRAGLTLSKAHICPHVEYRTGASILKTHRGGQKEDLIGGGLRGEVKGFSDASRRRLMYLIGGIRRDADLPLFITLTYPNAFPDAISSKRHLRMFWKRLDRYLKSLEVAYGLIWKLEPQKRGAPHYHILLWGCSLEVLSDFVPGAWFDIAGGGDEKHLRWHKGEFENQHCVQQVYSRNGVMRYASKYLGKTFEVEGWQKVGRYWGIINRANIPFGELVQEDVTRSKAVEIIRYQRRFSKVKKRNNKSLTTFCDVDQWVDKLDIGGSL